MILAHESLNFVRPNVEMVEVRANALVSVRWARRLRQ